MKKTSYYDVPVDLRILFLEYNEMANTIKTLGSIPFTLNKIKKLTHRRAVIIDFAWASLREIYPDMFTNKTSASIILTVNDENYGKLRVITEVEEEGEEE